MNMFLIGGAKATIGDRASDGGCNITNLNIQYFQRWFTLILVAWSRSTMHEMKFCLMWTRISYFTSHIAPYGYLYI
jgi:hypothetical protein